jgi:hypothetical protein
VYPFQANDTDQTASIRELVCIGLLGNVVNSAHIDIVYPESNSAFVNPLKSKVQNINVSSLFFRHILRPVLKNPLCLVSLSMSDLRMGLPNKQIRSS